jgi:CRISPR-associated protein Cmr4
MFEKSAMLYLYVETPLHAGSGGSIGVIDLPIQRERVTQFPLVQASGLKGKLRAEAYVWSHFITRRDALFPTELTQLKQEKAWENKDEKEQQRAAERRARKKAAKELGLEAVFGPENDEADTHAGALSPGDARLLLFPVRSLVGVFVWTTCRTILSRLQRDLAASGQDNSVTWTLDNLPDNGGSWTVDNNNVVANGYVVLEEFSFKATAHSDVKMIATWLAENAFPQTDDYQYFREKLQTSLVILPEDAFRDFTQFATEVVTRVRIDQEKRTVAEGALWTEEYLPSDTVLYAPLHASRPRTTNGPSGWKDADNVLQFVRNLNLDRIQLGGDETVGRGIVKLHVNGGS